MKTMNKWMCYAMLGCAAATAAAAVTDADKSFLAMAAQSDVNEITLSQLAATKATSSKVKTYAQKMVADHNMLEAKMKPFASAWSITPPSGPDAEHQTVLDKLNGLSGADFDKAYIDAMTMDHHKALDAFTTEVSTTTDLKFKATVKQAERLSPCIPEWPMR